MPIAQIFTIIIVHVAARYPLYRFSYRLLSLTYQQVKMIVHQAVGIVCTIAPAGIPVIVITYPHSVKSVDKLVVVLSVLEYILMIYSTHHHMATFGAASTVPRSLEHCQVTKVNKVNIPVPDPSLALRGISYILIKLLYLMKLKILRD